jgi:galactokinase
VILSELKKDFYRRFNASDNFLHLTANGIACPLLGYTDIRNAPSLSLTLSMRIQMLARKIDDNTVNVQASDSDKCFSYRFGTPTSNIRGADKFTADITAALERHNFSSPLRGAQILYDCSIPEFLPRKEVFSVTLAESLMKTSGIDYRKEDISSVCSLLTDSTPLNAVLSSKKGYASLVDGAKTECIPLPLSGFKIVSAHCTEKLKTHSKQTSYAFEKLQQLYPHINSFSDITPSMLCSAPTVVKDKAALRYISHLANENLRIQAAAEALNHCNIKGLFTQMKSSQKSMEMLWDAGTEHMFLAHCCNNTDGIHALRFWENGIIAITEENKIDYAIGMIRREFENNIGYQPTFCVSEPF